MATEETVKSNELGKKEKPREAPKIAPLLEMFLEGTRQKFTATVKYFKGGRPAKDEEFVLFVGTETNPYGDQLASDGNGTRPFKIKINSNGLGRHGFSLLPEEHFKNYTTFTAVSDDGRSITKPLKVLDEPNTDAEKNLPEIEVVNPPRDPDPTTGMFIVNVVTRRDGKKTNRDFVTFCDQTITIKQQVPEGYVVVTTFIPVAVGHYKLFIDFPGIMVKIVFKLDNGKETVVRLRK